MSNHPCPQCADEYNWAHHCKHSFSNLKNNSLMRTFYMVYLDGERGPAFRHNTYQSAHNEARRLARQHEKKAYILKAVKAVELIQFHETDLDEPQEVLPF